MLLEAKDLFGGTRFFREGGKVVGERQALIGKFAAKTGIEIGHVAFMVGHLKDLKDLYYIDSDCTQAAARGIAWSAAFRNALDPKKNRKS